MPADRFDQSGDPNTNVAVSVDVMKFLQNTGSPAANNAVTSNFGYDPEPTIKTEVP